MSIFTPVWRLSNTVAGVFITCRCLLSLFLNFIRKFGTSWMQNMSFFFRSYDNPEIKCKAGGQVLTPPGSESDVKTGADL